MSDVIRPGRGVFEDDQLGVPRSLLRDAVFMRMLRSILSGDYRRGQRLRLDAIADEMRVSRTPVREALVPLEGHRLVTVQRYVGVIIANWSVDQMVERLRIARWMLTHPQGCGPVGVERFDPIRLRESTSEAGALVELGTWVLRRTGASVSSDWLAAQHPVLDVFFTDDVAAANGIDAALDRSRRTVVVEAACAAAVHDDPTGCAESLVRLIDQLVELPERFRAPMSA